MKVLDSKDSLSMVQMTMHKTNFYNGLRLLGNHNGGANGPFIDTMNTLLNQTRLQAQTISDITKTPMGVIAERLLPTISLRPGEMQLNYKDPQTGESYARTFDLQGNYTSPGKRTSRREFMSSIDPKDILTGQLVDSINFFNDIARQFSDAVAQSGAIAPQWQVETINIQRQRGNSTAGLTTQQIAKNSGNTFWYGINPGYARPGNPGRVQAYSTQTFTPIVLDMNGDGQINTTSRYYGNGVLFDVDNDGYAEETDWIARREGILVLDRNGDGQINVGTDLFNDYGVDSSSRRLSVLNEINAGNPYYGTLDANDPVFGQLKVWMDINGDGVAQKGELQSMAQAGITSLDWSAFGQPSNGTFVQNGQTKQMQAVTLNANAAGVVTSVAGNSLLVEKRGQVFHYHIWLR